MRDRRLLSLLLSLAFIGLGGAAEAADTVWTGIVLAGKAQEPEPLPQQLTKVENALKGTFGYPEYKLLGQTTTRLQTGREDWSASTKYFTLQVDAKESTPSGYRLNIKLLQQSKLLVETDTELRRNSPMLIRGPFIGDGQLILVLAVK